MIAEAMVGNGDAAFDYYLRINPSAREAISEVHRCEPYVYAQMIAGRTRPTYGEAKNSWLTGTAAWNFVAITQWILGIRPELDGLRVDPVLPAAWAGFTATRRFRGATYQISVRNPDRISGRVGHLEVDGQRIEGTLVPLAPPVPPCMSRRSPSPADTGTSPPSTARLVSRWYCRQRPVSHGVEVAGADEDGGVPGEVTVGETVTEGVVAGVLEAVGVADVGDTVGVVVAVGVTDGVALG